MDYRIQKTKRSIYNAFIELRAKKPLEKLTIKELCETARINKSTFYVYYHDIYDLSDQIENEIISEVLRNLDGTDELLTNPASFTKKLFLAYSAQNSLINIVFTGNRAGQLPLKIESAMKAMIFAQYPQYENDVAFNIRLTYSIYGGYYAYNEYCRQSDARIADIIGQLSDRLMK